MADLVKVVDSSLVERNRAVADFAEDELQRFAVEAARDRDVSELWALTKAYLTLHESLGSRVSSHTFLAYKRALKVSLLDWQSVTLLKPGRNAEGLWVRNFGASKPAKGQNDTLSSATVRVLPGWGEGVLRSAAVVRSF